MIIYKYINAILILLLAELCVFIVFWFLSLDNIAISRLQVVAALVGSLVLICTVNKSIKANAEQNRIQILAQKRGEAIVKMFEQQFQQYASGLLFSHPDELIKSIDMVLYPNIDDDDIFRISELIFLELGKSLEDRTIALDHINSIRKNMGVKYNIDGATFCKICILSKYGMAGNNYANVLRYKLCPLYKKFILRDLKPHYPLLKDDLLDRIYDEGVNQIVDQLHSKFTPTIKFNPRSSRQGIERDILRQDRTILTSGNNDIPPINFVYSKLCNYLHQKYGGAGDCINVVSTRKGKRLLDKILKRDNY